MGFIASQKDPEIWSTIATTCQPEDIVDVADQINIVEQNDPALAAMIRPRVTAAVLGRLFDETLPPILAEKYFRTIPGYTEIVDN